MTNVLGCKVKVYMAIQLTLTRLLRMALDCKRLGCEVQVYMSIQLSLTRLFTNGARL